MVALDGAVALESEAGARRVVNQGSLELRDAVLVDLAGPSERKETYLGTIAPGASVEVKNVPRPAKVLTEADTFKAELFLRQFRAAYEDRPENAGEIRLVAWVQGPLAGQKIEPAVDRHRGFTAVVVHLKNGPSPAPDGPIYNVLAKAAPPGQGAAEAGTSAAVATDAFEGAAARARGRVPLVIDPTTSQVVRRPLRAGATIPPPLPRARSINPPPPRSK
jgi:hypothetical protein